MTNPGPHEEKKHKLKKISIDEVKRMLYTYKDIYPGSAVILELDSIQEYMKEIEGELRKLKGKNNE